MVNSCHTHLFNSFYWWQQTKHTWKKESTVQFKSFIANQKHIKTELINYYPDLGDYILKTGLLSC